MDGGLMTQIEISSDFGLKWGNAVFTPEELSDWVDGISLVDDELVFCNVKVVNSNGSEHFINSKGEVVYLSDLRDLLAA
jgi:hypothetical protein